MNIPRVEFVQEDRDQRVYIDGVDWTGRFSRMDVNVEHTSSGSQVTRIMLEFYADLYRGASPERLREAARELQAIADDLERKRNL